MALSRRVLAIDPGSRVTGYGIIDVAGQEVRYVDSGCIRLADEAMPLRLMMIHQGISELIRSYRPQEFAIEAIFVHKNPASALKLGQARGVAICAAVIFVRMPPVPNLLPSPPAAFNTFSSIFSTKFINFASLNLLGFLS